VFQMHKVLREVERFDYGHTVWSGTLLPHFLSPLKAEPRDFSFLSCISNTIVLT
jgi:hypothetical protein